MSRAAAIDELMKLEISGRSSTLIPLEVSGTADAAIFGRPMNVKVTFLRNGGFGVSWKRSLTVPMMPFSSTKMGNGIPISPGTPR